MSVQAYATDLGTMGPVYPIQEEDLLVWIQARLKQMQQDGSLRQRQRAVQKKMVAHIHRPPPVRGLSRTQKNTQRWINPSVTLSHDIRDTEGHVIAEAGTTVNPLHVVPLREPLIFIDGDDPKQWAWLHTLNARVGGNKKIILVKGPVMDLMKRLHQRLYFDQGGRLVAHFHVHHVPAIVTQVGDRLQVEERVP